MAILKEPDERYCDNGMISYTNPDWLEWVASCILVLNQGLKDLTDTIYKLNRANVKKLERLKNRQKRTAKKVRGLWKFTRMEK